MAMPRVGKQVIAKMVEKMKAAGKTTDEIKKKLSEFAKKAKDKMVEKGGKVKTAAKAGAVGGGIGYMAGKNRKKDEDEDM